MSKLEEKRKELKIITDKLQRLYDQLATKQIEQKVMICFFKGNFVSNNIFSKK
jgi:hypothetical protein